MRAALPHPVSLTWDLITELDRSERFEHEWTSLLSRCAVSDPTLTPRWQKTGWDVFGSEESRRLRLIAVREGGRLVGLAPLLLRRHWYRPGIPVRKLELVASGEPREDEIMSEYNGVLAERGREHDVAATMVRAVGDPTFGAWDELELPFLSPDNPMTGAMHRALLAAGHPSELTEVMSAAYIRLPGSWEAYLTALSSQSRYLVNRTLRDLDKWAGGDVSFHVARTPEALRRGQEILLALHAERWGSEDRPSGVFESDPFRAFHERMMPWLLERGALELAWLSARGEPIAVVYNFVWNDKTYQYQSGRRITLPSSVRAGIAVHAYAIREAIERGRREYDFLGGGDRFKAQLSTAARPLLRIRAARDPLTHLARRCVRRGGAAARALRGRLRHLHAAIAG